MQSVPCGPFPTLVKRPQLVPDVREVGFQFSMRLAEDLSLDTGVLDFVGHHAEVFAL